MKFAKTLTGIAIALFGAIALVSAGRYGANNQINNNYNSHGNNRGGYGGPLATNNHLLALTGGHHGPNYGGCRGYNCNSNLASAGSHHGPYHSYSVRPAIYGGHGMYHYRGYARNPLPPAAHYRPTRSYSVPCTGYPNCNSRGNQYHQRQPQRHHHHQRANRGYGGARNNVHHNGGYNRNHGATRPAGGYAANNGHGSSYGRGSGSANYGSQRGHRGASAGGY